MSDEFQKATEDVKDLKRRPSNEQLLQLYALFKQATEGDAIGKRPGMLDLKGRAKFDAWMAKKGLPSDTAKKSYVELVKKIQTELG